MLSHIYSKIQSYKYCESHFDLINVDSYQSPKAVNIYKKGQTLLDFSWQK